MARGGLRALHRARRPRLGGRPHRAGAREPNHFDRRDVELLSGYVEPAALAIDNARWFSRLRTVGAEEERNRLARDLHDRIGQSLAYLAFELDRLIRANERGDDVAPELCVCATTCAGS